MISYTIFSTSPRVLGKTRAGWASLRVRGLGYRVPQPDPRGFGLAKTPTQPGPQPNPTRTVRVSPTHVAA
jgi:hypothetical protein